MKRLGRGDRYCAVREDNVASHLEEPGTPTLEQGGVSEIVIFQQAKVIQP